MLDVFSRISLRPGNRIVHRLHNIYLIMVCDVGTHLGQNPSKAIGSEVLQRRHEVLGRT